MSVADDETDGEVQAGPGGSAAPDGGDVAGRNPDEIAREIEQTRAELADTIDAIAQRISPKRAATRGAEAVKAQVSSAKTKLSGEPNAWSVAAGGEVDAGGEPAAPAAPTPVDQVKAIAKRPEVMAITAALVLLVVFVRQRRSR